MIKENQEEKIGLRFNKETFTVDLIVESNDLQLEMSMKIEESVELLLALESVINEAKEFLETKEEIEDDEELK